jgi:hypothetical protein
MLTFPSSFEAQQIKKIASNYLKFLSVSKMSLVLKHCASVSEEMSNSSENQVESLPQSIEEKHQELVVSHVPIVLLVGETTGGGFETLGGDKTHCFISRNKKLTILKSLQYTPSLSL